MHFHVTYSLFLLLLVIRLQNNPANNHLKLRFQVANPSSVVFTLPPPPHIFTIVKINKKFLVLVYIFT